MVHPGRYFEERDMKLQLRSRTVSRARLIGILMIGILTLSLFISPASISAQSAPSPNEVLQPFLKMDAKGERLTASGWSGAAKFFVKPARRPQHYVVGVMFGEEIYDTRIKGHKAEVSVRRSALGQLDSAGRFTSVIVPELVDPPGSPSRQPEVPQIRGGSGIDIIYLFILTDTHWEFDPRGKELREVKGPPEWRLEYFEFEPWVTKDVAIRYLTKLREESSSQVVKGNADKSLAILRRAK